MNERSYIATSSRTPTFNCPPVAARPMATSVRGTVRGMATRANPAFAAGAVGIPLAALVYATTVAPLVHHTYVHVMAGVMWTGTDLFMAMVLGPVLGSLDVEERASVFRRFTPKVSFLLPSLALVTIAGGITLALRGVTTPMANPQPWLALFTLAATVPPLLAIGYQFDAFGDRRWQAWFLVAAVVSGAYLATTLPEFAMTQPIYVAVLAVMAVLNFVGFGVLLPGEVRIYRQMVSADPDTELIGAIGLRNAKLAGVQGTFQLSIIVLMVYLRWGGF
jgi:uncharacterized membrane protein